MINLKLSTKSPKTLQNEINDKIIRNEIRSWQFNDSGTSISHKGEQYANNFFYEYKVDDRRGILEFMLHPGGSDFANSRAHQLLERMLNSHFSNQIEIIK